ncbi:sn-glycerol-3-phosphate ABC transporter ATP-binding protein UgpC [Rhodobacteraceae bacterium NNCM2]|nr:sn-glycerol-3-phosphate ABC transporter ATP-binding protein UgpC [Coraliihabitans acroporae]
MATIAYRNITKRFDRVEVIKGLSLEIEDGEFVAYVGPSGCGKTTLLRLLAGLEQVTSGSVHIGDRDVTSLSPMERGVAMVFQNYALYPHMTVAENIGFGLRVRGTSRAERDPKVKAAAELLELGHLLDRKPRELSGGQRQRVAMGRAIVREPEVFLMDEPLSNLDAQLRNQMRAEIRALQRRLGTTMVYVTHDQIEAMTMADRIVVLRDGVIQQEGRPEDLFEHPANTFVAGFIGSPQMNLLPRDGFERGVREANGSLPDFGAAETVGVRPQHLHILGDEQQACARWPARVSLVESLGGEALLHLETAGQTVRLQHAGRATASVGDVLTVGFDPANVRLFDTSGAAIA